MNGSSTYVGLACGGSIPAATEDGSALTDEIVVIQRGTCTFQLKAETGYYAPGQVNDADYATGLGDLTMHNVEGDPTNADIAFISWYSFGMRVIEVNTGNSVAPPGDDWDAATPGVDDYYGENVTEVGRFTAEEGSNFWGVTVTEINGEQYVLGSDRNTGLWIFQYDPSY